ncbi:MAG: membrane protein insertase YidC, partial [Prevotellaceae bacterium]|nr:membrane protein insertase YidC [Prevotellaceae bacterium]
MDKNTATGLLLIVVIMGGYIWWTNKNTEEYNREQQRIRDSIAQVEMLEVQKDSAVQQAPIETISTDSARTAQSRESMGEILAASLEGEERFYTVENEKLRVKFTNKGGRISSVELKEYKSYDDF